MNLACPRVSRAVLALSLLLSLGPAEARACASCGYGDPTLTVLGAEQPFAGRLRFATELRYRWDELGDHGEGVELHEVQLMATSAWAPSDWLVLSAGMPLVVRHVRFANLAHVTVVGPGDAELRARAVLLRDRAFAPEHTLGVSAGVELPTSIDQLGPDGTLLPYEAQTGTGTLDALLGLVYAHFADPWSLFTSMTVVLPTIARYDEAPGPSLRSTFAVQYRADRHVTMRGGVDLRWDAPARIAERTDPTTDQLVVFLAPDLLWSPVTDVTLVLGLRVPVLQVTERARSEGMYVIASLVLDASA